MHSFNIVSCVRISLFSKWSLYEMTVISSGPSEGIEAVSYARSASPNIKQSPISTNILRAYT